MKHRRTLISVIAIILAVMMIAPLLLGAFSMTASAVTSDQLKKELDALKEEAAEIGEGREGRKVRDVREVKDVGKARDVREVKDVGKGRERETVGSAEP